VRDDPDSNVRTHALETWAQNPGANVDPAARAFVDRDESIRARAQELFEKGISRR
jgi:hypothetical protein